MIYRVCYRDRREMCNIYGSDESRIERHMEIELKSDICYIKCEYLMRHVQPTWRYYNIFQREAAPLSPHGGFLRVSLFAWGSRFRESVSRRAGSDMMILPAGCWSRADQWFAASYLLGEDNDVMQPLNFLLVCCSVMENVSMNSKTAV